MPYSDFTLKKVKEQLHLKLVETQDLFSGIIEMGISEYLSTTLKYNVPLALAVGTEKFRSELIIANILLEVRRILKDEISLFSGVNLDNAPIIAVVEAKNGYIAGGLGQCIT